MNKAASKQQTAAATETKAPAASTPAAITLIEAITQAMAYEMRADDSVVVLGEDGITTRRPGTLVKIDSLASLWCSGARMPPPQGTRNTIGHDSRPRVR